jgi:hypothetical protein
MPAKTKRKVCTNCGCEKGGGQPYEISVAQQRYFRNHLPLDLRREYDRVQKAQGNAAAFGYALSAVLDDTPLIRLPDTNTTIMPRRAVRITGASAV